MVVNKHNILYNSTSLFLTNTNYYIATIKFSLDIKEPNAKNHKILGILGKWCDSNSAIQIAKSPTFHEWTKHVEIDFHIVRQKACR